MLQRNRKYRLILGDYKSGKGILIEDSLQITFEVTKSADNKKTSNSAAVEVWNLSPASRALLETDYLSCSLEVGYEETGVRTILSGNVVQCTTRKSGADIVTQMILGEGYSDLNHQKVKSVIPAGKTYTDVIEEIRQQMPSVARGPYVGTNLSSPILSGYSLTGTPKTMLDRIAEETRTEWRLTNNTLTFSEINGVVEKSTKNVPVISEQTGLVDIPFDTSMDSEKMKEDKARKRGIQFKALLNPEIVPGKLVKIVSKNINGFFRVNSIRFTGDYRGNDWYVECVCARVDGVIEQ